MKINSLERSNGYPALPCREAVIPTSASPSDRKGKQSGRTCVPNKLREVDGSMSAMAIYHQWTRIACQVEASDNFRFADQPEVTSPPRQLPLNKRVYSLDRLAKAPHSLTGRRRVSKMKRAELLGSYEPLPLGIVQFAPLYSFVMATSSRTQEQPPYPSPSPRVQPGKTSGTGWLRHLLDQYFYFLMSLLIAAVVVYGFSHTVSKNLIHPTIPRPFVLYLHAVVFSGWVVFFILQTTLVRTGNVRIHRIMGRFGAALGAVVAALGVWTAITMERFNMLQLRHPRAPATLLIAFYDIATFAIPFALAIYWQKKTELHRRLMLVGCCALTAAAFSRMPILLWVPNRVFVSVGVDLLIFLGVARDLIVNRRVHRVYIYALPAFIISQIAVAYTYQSAYWLKIAHTILD